MTSKKAKQLLAKFQEAGAEFREVSTEDKIKVKPPKGGFSPEDTQELIAHRTEIEELCRFDEYKAYELISEAFAYMRDHCEEASFLKTYHKHKAAIEMLSYGGDMPRLRAEIRNMVREAVKGEKK